MVELDKPALFFSWLSELGSGTRTQFTRVMQSYFRDELGAAGGLLPDDVLFQLQDLGHLELDWSAGRWTVAPSRLHLLPGGHALAVWTGRRSQRTISDMEQHGLFVKALPPLLPRGVSCHLPATLLLEFDSFSQVRSACAKAGVLWEESYVYSLATALLQVNYEQGSVPGPELFGPGLQRFDPLTFRYENVVGPPRISGLYRQRTFGQSRYWGMQNGLWFQTSRAVGEWLNAGKAGTNLIGWTPDGRFGGGTLTVPEGIRLPPQHIEVLVACSGTLPMRIPEGRLAYPNVDENVATAVQKSLRITPTTNTSIELGAHIG